MTNNFKKIILILGDIGILYLSLYLTLVFRYGNNFDIQVWQNHLFPFSLVYLSWMAIFYLARLYEPNFAKNNYEFYSIFLKSMTIAGFFAIGIFYIIPTFLISPKTNLIVNIIVFSLLFVLWRQFYNNFLKSSALSKKVLFVGENKEVAELILLFSKNPQLGYKALEPLLDTQKNIKELIQKEKINIIVNAKGSTEEKEFTKILYSLLPLGVTVYDITRFYPEITKKIPVSIIGETWFLENLLETEKGLYEKTKRFFDILFAIFLGILTIPFFPLIALAIILETKGGTFYTQARVGKNEKIFKLLKFRTMVQDAEKDGAQWTTDKDTRVTKVGNILRKTRIDELPQLLNVLKGDMSFVGPRPERPEFVQTLEKEIPHYQIRHLVRPGLSGWAQINQPTGDASVKESTEKLQYDLYYIKNRSLVFDLDVLAKTIMVVLRRQGH
jgi:exopolysaccharide biosynthesis polyprenyl glycosylphosphotransferase